MSNLTLKAFLELSDRITAPLKVINKSVDDQRKLFLEDKKALQDLQKQQGNVNAFRKMQQAIGETRTKIKEMTAAEAQFIEAMKNTLAPTKAQQRELNKTREILNQLKTAQSGQISQLKDISVRLNAAGFSTKGFTASETQLAERIRVANSAMDAQRAKLKSLEAQQISSRNAQREHEERMSKINSAKSGGMTAAVTGGGILYGLDKTVEPAKEWQQLTTRLRVTGVGDPTVQHFQELAKHNKIKGISENGALESLTEAQIIMRNPHEVEELMPGILKAKATLESLYKAQGHGDAGGEADSQVRDMIKTIELRGGTKSVAAFQEQQDYMMRAIMGSGGVLKSTDWLDAIKTGGAATKMMGNESFYYVLGHMIQESGGFRAGTGAMSAFSNLAMGRTTEQSAKFMAENGLIDKSQLTISKKTDKAMLGAGALASAKLFANNPFQWMMDDLVPKLSKKFKADHHRDVTDDEMKMLLPQAFSNRTAGNAFLQMYMDRGNIARQLVAYRGAYGLNEGYNATFETTQGKQDDAVAKFNTLKTELGKSLLPMLNSALETLLGISTAITSFTEEFPGITKGIMDFIAILGVLLLVFGGLLFIVASILGPILALRATLGLVSLAFGGVGGAAGGLPSLLGGVGGALGALKIAAAAFIAWEAGQYIGGKIYDNMSDEHKDDTGGTIATFLSWFGDKDAEDSIDRNNAMRHFDPNAPIRPRKPTPVATKPIMARNVPSYADTHKPASFQIDIHGVTDPAAVGQEVRRQLEMYERKLANQKRGALTDPT